MPERDEPVDHGPERLAELVAVAEAIPERGNETRLGVMLGEEALDRAVQGRPER
jgi:hypothetical protein